MVAQTQINLLTVKGRQLSVAVYRKTIKPYANGTFIKLKNKHKILKKANASSSKVLIKYNIVQCKIRSMKTLFPSALKL